MEQQRLAEQQRIQLESRLATLQQEKAAVIRLREQLELTVKEEQQRSASLSDNAALLTEKLAEQQRSLEHQARLNARMERKLQAEEQKSRRLQKQLQSFTVTMEEVSKVLYSVEREEKVAASGSLSRSERKVRSSAADTLRQSLAAFKAFKETEGPEGPQPDQDKQLVA
ncbi:hypothetical protein HXX76_013003 [Chlamydomonas incerta]|uniref:Cilia- and flagella-associated protein 157 n=1 Tax=Chlamydomonas incerta TaxID=51695 RepID=A0A835STA7_CHLIN|nr:hypothetical protein HXX76_013003 [Chlamydomonas incerta]|eukprot:KAG2426245.1 hypothetical protein HXX76_013003 [Chlamydomonas incerta]